jgi:Electron transfer flavoprotein domain
LANLLVNIDLRAGVPTTSSIFALQAARSVALEFGATVVSMVITGPLALPDLERLARILGESGADRALVCSDPVFSRPPLWSDQGRVLRLVTDTLRPRLVFLPAGTVSAQLGPPLAALLGATLIPHASCEISHPKDGEPQLRVVRRTPRWDGIESTDALATIRPIVAILRAGRPERISAGSIEAELELLPIPAATEPEIDVLSSREDAFDAAIGAQNLFLLTTDIETSQLKESLAMPEGTAIIRNTPEAPASNLDVACPEKLFVLSEQSLPNPPPVVVAARGYVALCGPRKPPGTRFPGVYLRSDLASPDRLIQDLATGATGDVEQ